ncbi:MAG: argininosuccinate synthase [Rhodothermaceae bacterium]|nr:argininosuccinate synthase [Rhodothermaceae bacterium]MXZ17440.1 argininosuccinate synthase [Rhodothermaceae bacterium]MYE62903.1 argininosuccinate synthase [Rhodothermaceae bacterium]MYG70755.1 argininosuccinate synthase [Rhodothermaceae bacterium]MYJ19452.1 argininosuccinate synthase [Rhodothermaceae bacterium]
MGIVLAFSGGLDTSFCVPYLREKYDESVFTVTVNTGASLDETALKARSKKLGAEKHFHIDARQTLYEDYLKFLIMGNVLRGGVYPLCVGAERVVQALEVVKIARQVGARAIAHGSTGAGNDQVRFDSVVHLFADEMELITPIRDEGLTRQDTTGFLLERGFSVPEKTTRYSINEGLWGTTIGGEETLGTAKPLPDEAYPHTVPAAEAPEAGLELRIQFENGLPIALDGEELPPVALITKLASVGAEHGVGRNIHVGDTILGLKGRIGFEAPAPLILITAHRELEKLVLTKWQRYQKDQLSDFYGMLLHEGQYFDPVMRDIEAFLTSSQHGVTGSVFVRLYKGNISVQGCESPYSMFDTGVATYGEETALWDGPDARSFSKLSGLQAYLAYKARSKK